MNATENETLSALIDEAAAKSGTRTELARQLGVPRPHVSNWRNGTGDRRPNVKTLASLCRIAGKTGDAARRIAVAVALERLSAEDRAAAREVFFERG